jgi:hypothetical protein
MAKQTKKIEGRDEKPETTEMFPEGDGQPKPSTRAKAKPEPDELDGALGATKGEESDAESDIEAPDIQPAGAFPTAEDAYADMSEPPPEEPIEFMELNHGSGVPREAFWVIPQKSLISLFMFTLPFGTAMQGEEFVQAIDKKILDQFRKECPHLKVERFEIWLLQLADGSYYFLEVPADPRKTKQAERTRESLLKLLKLAQTRWVIGVKIAGIWGKHESPCSTFMAAPHQSYKELVDRTYGDKIHRDMSRAVLQRYRRIVD